ncbi:MAG: polysaccharide biosynthesis tyrosine autokinase [Gemmatimonadaceae bacterium]
MNPTTPPSPASPTDASRAGRAVPPSAAAGELTTGGIPWERYLAALRRRRLVAGAIAAAVLAAGAYATRVLPPTYEVRSSIWVAGGPDRRSASATHGDALLASRAWAEVLRSYAVLDPVVERLSLFVSPVSLADSALFRDFHSGPALTPGTYAFSVGPEGRRYELTDAKGTLVERGAVGDSVGSQLGFRWRPSRMAVTRGRRSVFTVVLPRQAAMKLRERIEVGIPDTSFLIPRLSGTNPQRDAATLNDIGREFVATATDLTKRTRVQVVRQLETQLSDAEQSLRSAENKMGSYRTGAVGLPTQDDPSIATRDPTLGAFYEQKAQLDNVHHDRVALQRVLADPGRNTSALLAIPSVREAPELTAAIADLTKAEDSLEALRRAYTNDYPPVRALRANVERMKDQTLPALAQGVLARLRTREEDLSARSAGASSELRGAPSRMIAQQRLQRDVQVNSGLYTALRSQYDAARLAELTAVPGIAVLDTAVAPLKPLRNTVPGVLAAALLAGLTLGVGAALLLDAADKRLWYPEQVAVLNLEVLGSVPVAGGTGGTPTDPVAAGQLTESFRSLRVNLRHALQGETPIMLCVLSAEMGDGKSFVSRRLAQSFAEAGHRTLLVDGDIRRGALAAAFTSARSPGLTEYLGGAAPLSAIVRRTRHPLLFLIPCGTRLQEGPELLASEGLPRLLTLVATEYDAIIVDGPPLGAGADASSLATATRNAIFVLRVGKTDRKEAKARLNAFAHLPVRRLGAVLNALRPEGAFRYYSYLPEYAVYPEKHSEPGAQAERGESERQVAVVREPAGAPEPLDGADRAAAVARSANHA